MAFRAVADGPGTAAGGAGDLVDILAGPAGVVNALMAEAGSVVDLELAGVAVNLAENGGNDRLVQGRRSEGHVGEVSIKMFCRERSWQKCLLWVGWLGSWFQARFLLRRRCSCRR